MKEIHIYVFVYFFVFKTGFLGVALTFLVLGLKGNALPPSGKMIFFFKGESIEASGGL